MFQVCFILYKLNNIYVASPDNSESIKQISSFIIKYIVCWFCVFLRYCKNDSYLLFSIYSDDELKANYTKKDGEMNWMKLRGIFRKQLATDLKEEWNEMWEDEKLGEKLTKLRQIIKNTPETAQPAW